MGQILKRPHLVLGERALPADVQHRALRPERGGDPGERVGEARAGRGDHAPEPAGLARVPIGRVGRHLLVPHVDDADILVDAPVVGVDDVPAAQREDGVDALVGQRPGCQVPTRDDVLVPALASERVFGGPGFQCGCGRHEQILRDGFRIEPAGLPASPGKPREPRAACQGRRVATAASPVLDARTRLHPRRMVCHGTTVRLHCRPGRLALP